MEDSRNIIKAIDALTLKAGGEVVDSKNITEAIDHLKAVYDQEAIGIDDTLTQEGLAADAKATGDEIASLNSNTFQIRGRTTDANNATNAGAYLTAQSTTNIPEQGEFVLEVQTAWIFVYQFLHTPTKTYFRRKNSAGWNDWTLEPTRAEITELNSKSYSGLEVRRDTQNVTTFTFLNLPDINAVRHKHFIVVYGDGSNVNALAVYHGAINTTGDVVLNAIEKGSDAVTITASVTDNELKITGASVIWGGVRLIWLS